MEAKDVMTTRVITVSPDTRVEAIAKLLMDERISGVPVVDNDGRLVGIVSEGDLMRRSESGTDSGRSPWLSLLCSADESARAYLKSHGHRARDVMSTDVISVDEHTPLARVAQILERNRIKRVPVLRDGALVGIVSRANLLQGLVSHGPPPISANDRELRARILGELCEAGLDALPINVVAANGKVHLWGVVGSEAQREAVRLAATEAAGVGCVDDHLSVLAVALRGTWSR
jgi:CBS domain-containing protein